MREQSSERDTETSNDLVTMPEGFHPFPSRTRKLRPPGPMILGLQSPGKVGRCQVNVERPSCKRWSLCFSLRENKGVHDTLGRFHPFSHTLVMGIPLWVQCVSETVHWTVSSPREVILTRTALRRKDVLHPQRMSIVCSGRFGETNPPRFGLFCNLPLRRKCPLDTFVTGHFRISYPEHNGS